MGWGNGTVNGIEVGYMVADVCHEPGCDREIDRGLAHACGMWTIDRVEGTCQGFFCGDHLGYTPGVAAAVCSACAGKLGDDELEDDELGGES